MVRNERITKTMKKYFYYIILESRIHFSIEPTYERSMQGYHVQYAKNYNEFCPAEIPILLYDLNHAL